MTHNAFDTLSPDWWDKASLPQMLEVLHTRGFGAKKLSRALGGTIPYRTLHRWKAGGSRPRDTTALRQVRDFGKSLLGGHTTEQEGSNTACPF